MLQHRTSVICSARSLFCIWLACASASAATFETIYNFGNGTDGAAPQSLLTPGANGVLYGTTGAGGGAPCGNGYGCGTVFSLTPPSSPGGAWTETILWAFGNVAGDGMFPVGGLVIGSGGVLYGATQGGGNNACNEGCGTVFSLTPPASPGGQWTETVLYSFAGGNDGANPYAGPVIGRGGVLYGTTEAGGPSGAGTVYSVTPPASAGGAWTEAVLHSFLGGVEEGGNPVESVVIGHNGVLYGTTAAGGSPQNGGTVFSLSPPQAAGGGWTNKALYRFDGLKNHGGAGEVAASDLVIGAGGVLYGATETIPTVFSLTPPSTAGDPWTETVLTSSSLLVQPRGALVRSPNSGTIFGTSFMGGSSQSCGGSGCGAVWSLTPPSTSGGAWVCQILHSFDGTDGQYPWAGLSGAPGALYGTTQSGGAYGGGTAFAIVE